MEISESLKTYLIGTLDGFAFEHLIQQLLAVRDGDQFVALGGVKDGGADGFFRDVLEDSKKPTSFLQISIQENAAKKIRDTVKRLREFGREVRTLTYWTSQRLTVDVLEDELSDELDVALRIRDWNAVSRLITTSADTQSLFLREFRQKIVELTGVSQATSEQSFDVVSDPSIYVFLQYERGERFKKGGLIVPIVDALIFWSLRDTDPDENKFITRIKIKDDISALLPAAARNLIPHVDERLGQLATKDGGGEQRIRFYSKIDSFCIPYNVRVKLAAASATELNLKAVVRQSLRERALKNGADQPDSVIEVCERAIYRHFNEQGLILAAFLEKRLDEIQISDQIVEKELQAEAATGAKLSRASYISALKVLQGVFYDPTLEENEFLHRLSRTSMLLFSLKHCPQLIEYFNQMTAKFRLFVGTDILVKALSETFLPAEHRHVTNLLAVAKACGATLLLAQPVVNELYSHLHATHLEFRNYYAEQEPYITASMAAQSDRIMIRTYFYARLLLNRVKGWKSFIEMFVDYDELAIRSDKGADQLSAYLCKVFNLEQASLDEEGKKANEDEVQVLADALEKNNAKNAILAKNDALMVLSVYAQRLAAKEVARYDGFGVKTWWLTKQTRVLASTGSLVHKNHGVPYIMRPEFLLNFLSLSPATSAVDPVLRDLLPSHVGLQIGQHLPQGHMHKILTEIDEWKALPPARREVRVTDAVNQLKYDRLKRYESNLELNSGDEADAMVAALNAHNGN
jgi:hypothetical protein